MFDHIKDSLKLFGAILTISATPEGLSKGVAITVIILIAVMLWKLLKEFKTWRVEQTKIAEDVRKITIDTSFLVKKHCARHLEDANELLALRESEE